MLQQMDLCQKALANYLEDKRSAFPRFYFIGDDDLLEVRGCISNAISVSNVMFIVSVLTFLLI